VSFEFVENVQNLGQIWTEVPAKAAAFGKFGVLIRCRFVRRHGDVPPAPIISPII
jgi:hypothetical protein